jgi:hypothetical protein
MNELNTSKIEIFKNRDKTRELFDIIHYDDLKYFDNKIELIHNEYLNLSLKNPSFFFQETYEFSILIFRSIEYFISAISLIRERAFYEAGTILRMCLETASTAYHIL